MIQRIVIFLLLLILLPDIYRAWCNSRRKNKKGVGQRLLRWIPSLLMAVATILLACTNGFIPHERIWLDLYIWVLGLYFIPRFALRLCTALGRLFRPLSRRRRNWGRPIGLLLACCCLYIFIYGNTIGPRKLHVQQMEMTFADLPEAFDGYRIVVCSDLHLGSQRQSFVERIIDTVNLQQPDAVCFLGDLQNTDPDELYPYTTLLRSISARDGVFSVLGNHDYSYYSCEKDEAIRQANERETINRERQAGWQVLMNSHVPISRGSSTIYMAGSENFSDRPYRPSMADIPQTLDGIPPKAFTIMLQHNPKAWQEDIVGKTDVQLTLSGHTHGGQMSFFDLRLSKSRYTEDSGLYTQGHQRLVVTTGLGGLLPFRFNMPPEIIVITLKK